MLLGIINGSGSMTFKKGCIPWNKGKVGVQIHTSETKRKMSISKFGNTNGFKKGKNLGNIFGFQKGLRNNPDGEFRKGHKLSFGNKSSFGRFGEEANAWKGGCEVSRAKSEE